MKAVALRKKRRLWTTEEEAILRELVAKGESSICIAHHLGFTKNAVDHKKSKLGLYTTYHKLSSDNPLHVAEVVKFKMAGWKLVRIAKVYGVNSSTVSRVLCDNGFKWFMVNRSKLKHPRRFWSEFELALLRKYLRRGYSLSRLQFEFRGRSAASLQKKCHQITRYWLTPEQQAERKRLRANHMKWRIW